jgi:hypothetical protein
MEHPKQRRMITFDQVKNGWLDLIYSGEGGKMIILIKMIIFFRYAAEVSVCFECTAGSIVGNVIGNHDYI